MQQLQEQQEHTKQQADLNISKLETRLLQQQQQQQMQGMKSMTELQIAMAALESKLQLQQAQQEGQVRKLKNAVCTKIDESRAADCDGSRCSRRVGCVS